MKKKKIAIIGAGPAGTMCAIEASKNLDNEILLIEQKEILATLLPTGGGRCNLAHNEYTPLKLASYFPRGEKFLYSVFSRFGTKEAIDFFNSIGVKTKVQEDDRIFPVSDSAKLVRAALLKVLEKSNIRKIKSLVVGVSIVDGGYEVVLSSGKTLLVDAVVVATGGMKKNLEMIKKMGHTVIQPRPSLCPLKIQETQFYELAGVSISKLNAKIKFENKVINKFQDDLLFTHASLSGPLILKISSFCAFYDFNEKSPLKLEVNFVNEDTEVFKNKLKTEFNSHPKKSIINVCSNFLSRFLVQKLLEEVGVPINLKSSDISKVQLRSIVEIFTHFTFNIIGRVEQSAMVTAGGVSLKEINSKNLESKLQKNLFFAGEVLDIDGVTGGFNLQNCWSGGFIIGEYLKENN